MESLQLQLLKDDIASLNKRLQARDHMNELLAEQNTTLQTQLNKQQQHTEEEVQRTLEEAKQSFGKDLVNLRESEKRLKEYVVGLERKIKEYESQNVDEITNLKLELAKSQQQLQSTNQDFAKLKEEFLSQSQLEINNLQNQIKEYKWRESQFKTTLHPQSITTDIHGRLSIHPEWFQNLTLLQTQVTHQVQVMSRIMDHHHHNHNHNHNHKPTVSDNEQTAEDNAQPESTRSSVTSNSLFSIIQSEEEKDMPSFEQDIDRVYDSSSVNQTNKEDITGYDLGKNIIAETVIVEALACQEDKDERIDTDILNINHVGSQQGTSDSQNPSSGPVNRSHFTRSNNKELSHPKPVEPQQPKKKRRKPRTPTLAPQPHLDPLVEQVYHRHYLSLPFPKVGTTFKSIQLALQSLCRFLTFENRIIFKPSSISRQFDGSQLRKYVCECCGVDVCCLRCSGDGTVTIKDVAMSHRCDIHGKLTEKLNAMYDTDQPKRNLIDKLRDKYKTDEELFIGALYANSLISLEVIPEHIKILLHHLSILKRSLIDNKYHSTLSLNTTAGILNVLTEVLLYFMRLDNNKLVQEVLGLDFGKLKMQIGEKVRLCVVNSGLVGELTGLINMQ